MTFINFIGATGGGGGLTVFTLFFGERTDSMDPPSGSPLSERNSFLSYLTGVTSDGWEDESLASSLTSAQSQQAGGLTATWTRDDGTPTHIYSSGVSDMWITDNTANGRFNTTSGGDRWLESLRPIVVTFSANIKAFGAYFTDVGDFDRQMTIELTDENDNVTSYQPAHGSGAEALFFWGFIDPTGLKYKQVRISMSGDFVEGGGTEEDPHATYFDDAFGLDDVIAAT